MTLPPYFDIYIYKPQHYGRMVPFDAGTGVSRYYCLGVRLQGSPDRVAELPGQTAPRWHRLSDSRASGTSFDCVRGRLATGSALSYSSMAILSIVEAYPIVLGRYWGIYLYINIFDNIRPSLTHIYCILYDPLTLTSWTMIRYSSVGIEIRRTDWPLT